MRAFPLLAHGDLLGTIAFASTNPAGLSAPADVELLKMLANQFSVALDRMRLVRRLRDSETRYRGAVITGRIAAWETDMVLRRRVWTEEGMALFGLDLPNGIGQVGGENDEFQRALHPDDKHMMAQFHRTADQVTATRATYRIVRPDGTMLWVSGRGRVVARRSRRQGAARRQHRGRHHRAQEGRGARPAADARDDASLQEPARGGAGDRGAHARTAGTLKEFEPRYPQRLQGLRRRTICCCSGAGAARR